MGVVATVPCPPGRGGAALCHPPPPLLLSLPPLPDILIAGWKVILEAFDITAGTISSCIKTLSEDHILSISPGGVREAQFSDHNYQLILPLFQLRTHLGEPLYPKPGESPEELAERIQEAVSVLIRENQRLPGRILRALLARVYEAPKQN